MFQAFMDWSVFIFDRYYFFELLQNTLLWGLLSVSLIGQSSLCMTVAILPRCGTLSVLSL